jgi:plasmid rolling circle replication initiator protein Rep
MCNNNYQSRQVYVKRAKAKYTQQKLLRALLKLNSKYAKRYDSALYCSSVLIQKGNKLTSRFCNQRFCNLCNRIRTAKLLNGYAPALEKMVDPRLVTLTIPSCKGEDLKYEIRKMICEVKKMQDLRRKLKRDPIVGLRKLEVTYNPDIDLYHPHFHFIVDGENLGNEMIQEWMDRNPTADRRGQDERKATSPKELFKYFTKMTSKSKSDTVIIKNGKMIRLSYQYPEAIDTIFQAIENSRIIQPMGGVKMISEDVDVDIQTITDIDEDSTTWIYHRSDWVNTSTGELLSGYIPSKLDESKRKKIRYLQESS